MKFRRGLLWKLSVSCIDVFSTVRIVQMKNMVKIVQWNVEGGDVTWQKKACTEGNICLKIEFLAYSIWYDIFVNWNWVASQRQLYSTHLHTNNTQSDTKQTIHRTTQKLEECGSCPVFASNTLAFALQLGGKTRKNPSQGSRTIRIHKPNNKNT
jgi:hypothetical protein